MQKNISESANAKRTLLRYYFGKKREEYKGFTDDRQVFCNIYDMLMQSLDEMEKVENNYIWVAFNKAYREDFNTLKEIDNYFSKSN